VPQTSGFSGAGPQLSASCCGGLTFHASHVVAAGGPWSKSTVTNGAVHGETASNSRHNAAIRESQPNGTNPFREELLATKLGPLALQACHTVKRRTTGNALPLRAVSQFEMYAAQRGRDASGPRKGPRHPDTPSHVAERTSFSLLCGHQALLKKVAMSPYPDATRVLSAKSNLEQQKKQARELLRAANAGEAAALQRIIGLGPLHRC
jgi:hypothetical protein